MEAKPEEVDSMVDVGWIAGNCGNVGMWNEGMWNCVRGNGNENDSILCSVICG